MSDLCMYKLEDNVWDEFCESGDLIVPRPGDEDGGKKAKHGAIDMTDCANNATKYSIHGKEGRMTKNDTMLEKGSWFQTPDGVLGSSDGESNKELTGITNNDSRTPGSVSSEFCANVPILADSNNNSYDYPLSHVSQADNELSFYDNDGEDKETSDLLDYEWPDIGNFEDVDRMLRSCDSTFGLGSLSNDEELCWFSPSRATEVPEEALKPDFNFPCPESSVLKNVLEPAAPSVQDNTGPSTNYSDTKSVSLSNKASSQTTDADDLVADDHIQFMNDSDIKSENSAQPLHKGQISLKRKQSTHHGRPDGKRKYCYSENGGSFNHSSDLKQFVDVKHPFGDSSESKKLFSPIDIGEHKQNKGAALLTYAQPRAPYMHLDFSSPSDQISVPSLSGTKSENNSQPSPSPKESSHGSNRVSAQKQMHQSKHGIGGHSEVEGAGTPVELDLSGIQESTSNMSSVLGVVSPQASSFCQLQQVVEQLDIRTKLCIRDSLYRLARSAEQRHNYLNPSGGISNDRDVTDDTNKCAGFMDIETNTNPIDRSIAHLLFHRPQDPSIMPATDAPSLKFHSKVHVPLMSPPMKSEEQVFQETVPGTDNKLLMDGEK